MRPGELSKTMSTAAPSLTVSNAFCGNIPTSVISFSTMNDIAERACSAAHRHATGVGDLDPILLLEHVRPIFPAAEQPHLDPHAAGAEGFLALHRREDRRAGILLGPYAGQS